MTSDWRFAMKLKGFDECIFEWKGGSNPVPKLEDGHVSFETDELYTYQYGSKGSPFTSALVVSKRHFAMDQLPPPMWCEVGLHWSALTRQRLDLNLSSNFGYVAGQRWEHFHLHGISREDEGASSTWGFKSLIGLYDNQTLAVKQIIATCEHEPTRLALEALLQK